MTAEHLRLDEAREKALPWKQWGPYLSERDQTGWTGLIARAMHLFATLKPESLLAGGKKSVFARRVEETAQA